MSKTARIGATLGASLILALSACTDAQADSWTGRDKQMHAIAGAAIALPVTLITRDVSHGIVAGCAVGVAKELADKYRPGHVASYRDAIVTCAGAAIGAALGGVIVAPAERGVYIGIARSF